MDSFLSQTLQPLLQQYIENYSKEQIKINFLKGKGVMRNIVLNVDEINARLPPEAYRHMRFARVAMDQVAFKASLTRIKTQPVSIYVERMDIDLYEQTPKSSRQPTTHPTASCATASPEQSPPGPSGPLPLSPYTLQQRILDGIRVEIREIRFRVRALGRRKCGKAGEWNPPDGLWVFRDLVLLSVTEEGLEGNLEECWRFNKQRFAAERLAGRPKDYYLFKQLRMGSMSLFLLPRDTLASSTSGKCTSSGSRPNLLIVEETPLACDIMIRRSMHDVNCLLDLEVDVRIDRFKMRLGLADKTYEQWFAFIVALYCCAARPGSALAVSTSALPDETSEAQQGTGPPPADPLHTPLAEEAEQGSDYARKGTELDRISSAEIEGFEAETKGTVVGDGRLSLEYASEDEEEGDEGEEEEEEGEEGGESTLLTSADLLGEKEAHERSDIEANTLMTPDKASPSLPRVAMSVSIDDVQIRLVDDIGRSNDPNDQYLPSPGADNQESDKGAGWLWRFQRCRVEDIRPEAAGPDEHILQMYLGSFDLKVLDGLGEGAVSNEPVLLRPTLATLLPKPVGKMAGEAHSVYPTLEPFSARGEGASEGGGHRGDATSHTHLEVPDTVRLKLHTFAYPPPPPPRLAGTLEVNIGRKLQVLANAHAWRRLLDVLVTHTDARCMSGDWGRKTRDYTLQDFPPPGVRDVVVKCQGLLARMPSAPVACEWAEAGWAFSLGIGISSLRISHSLLPSSYFHELMDSRLRLPVENQRKSCRRRTPRSLTPPLSQPKKLVPLRLEVCMADVNVVAHPHGHCRQNFEVLPPTSLNLYVSVEDRLGVPRPAVLEDLWYVPLDAHASLTVALSLPDPVGLHINPPICKALALALWPPAYCGRTNPRLGSETLSKSSFLLDAIASSSFDALATCASLQITLYEHSDCLTIPSSTLKEGPPLFKVAFYSCQAMASKVSCSGLLHRLHMTHVGRSVLEMGLTDRDKGILLRFDDNSGSIQVPGHTRLHVPLEDGPMDRLVELLRSFLPSPRSIAGKHSTASIPVHSFWSQTRSWEYRAVEKTTVCVSTDGDKSLRFVCEQLLLKGSFLPENVPGPNDGDHIGTIVEYPHITFRVRMHSAYQMKAGADWEQWIPGAGILVKMEGNPNTREESRAWSVSLEWSNLPSYLHLSSSLATILTDIKERVRSLARKALPRSTRMSVESFPREMSFLSRAELNKAERVLSKRTRDLSRGLRHQMEEAMCLLNEAKKKTALAVSSHRRQLQSWHRRVERKELQRQHALAFHHADFAGFLHVGSLISPTSMGKSKRTSMNGVKAKHLINLPRLWCVLRNGLLLCYDQPNSFKIERVLTVSDKEPCSNSVTLQPFTPSDRPSSRFYDRLYALSYCTGDDDPLFLVCQEVADLASWKEALGPYVKLDGASDVPSSVRETPKRAVLLHRLSSDTRTFRTGKATIDPSPRGSKRFSLKGLGFRKTQGQQHYLENTPLSQTLALTCSLTHSTPNPPALKDEPTSPSLLSTCTPNITAAASSACGAGSDKFKHLSVIAQPLVRTGREHASVVASYTMTSRLVERITRDEHGCPQDPLHGHVETRSWSVTHSFPVIQAFHEEYTRVWTTARRDDNKVEAALQADGRSPHEAMGYAHQLLEGAAHLLKMPFPSPLERQEQGVLLGRYWQLVVGTCQAHGLCRAFLGRFLRLPDWALQNPQPHMESVADEPIPVTTESASADVAADTIDISGDNNIQDDPLLSILSNYEEKLGSICLAVRKCHMTNILYTAVVKDHGQAIERESSAGKQRVEQLQEALQEEKRRGALLVQEVVKAQLIRDDAVAAMTEVSLDAGRKLMESELRYAAFCRKLPHHLQPQSNHRRRPSRGHTPTRHVQSHHHATGTGAARLKTTSPPSPLQLDGSRDSSASAKSFVSSRGLSCDRGQVSNLRAALASEADGGVRPVTSPRQRRQQLEELLMSSNASMSHTLFATSNAKTTASVGNFKLSRQLSSMDGESSSPLASSEVAGVTLSTSNRCPSPTVTGAISQAHHYDVVFKMKGLLAARLEEVGSLKERLKEAEGKVKMYEDRVHRWGVEARESVQMTRKEKTSKVKELGQEAIDDVLDLWRERVGQAEDGRKKAERLLKKSRAQWKRLLTQIKEEESDNEIAEEEEVRESGRMEEGSMRRDNDYRRLLRALEEGAML